MTGDARPAAGGWALRTICFLGAAAMAAAGLYLLDPSLLDLGLYVEQGKYALGGYTLAYAGLIVGFAATAGALRTGWATADFLLSLVAGPFALFGLGAVFGALAGDALIFRDPANYWVGLLAIPSALCFAASSLSEKAEKRADSDGEEDDADDDADNGSGGSLLGGLFWFVAYIAVAIIAGILAIQAGFLLFYLLQANLLDGRDVDVARIGPALLNLMREVVSERWVIAVLIGGVIAALFLLFLFFAAVSAFLSRGEPERAITGAEEALIAQRAAELRAYAERRGYSRYAKRFFWFVTLPSLFAPMLIVLIVGVSAERWSSWPYDAVALQSLGWHLYEHRMGASIIVMMFAALLWGVVPNAILSRLSPAYAEIAGWSGFATGRQTVEDYLAQQFRTGALSPEQAFDPGAFLRRIAVMFEPYFLFPAVPLTLLAAILWHHDMSRYHLLTERTVEVMSYWSLERHRYSYGDVQSVVLGCSYDKDGREEASYAIVLPNGFSIELFRNGPENNVADLAKVDAKIGQSTPRVFAMRTPLFRPAVNDYDALCVETLAASLPEAERGRFREIFRVEDWHRRRWRERIGVGPVKSL